MRLWIGLDCIVLDCIQVMKSQWGIRNEGDLDIDWKGRQASIEHHHQEEARVREGGAVLCSFIDWFLLLVACLLAWSLSSLVSRVSCLVCVSSYLHLFGLSSVELGSSLCRCESERD